MSKTSDQFAQMCKGFAVAFVVAGITLWLLSWFYGR